MVRRKCRPNQFFIVMRIIGSSVYLRRVKESDAHIHGSGDQLTHLLLVSGRTVALTHPHTPEPDRRNGEISKFAILHLLPSISIIIPLPFPTVKKKRIAAQNCTAILLYH